MKKSLTPRPAVSGVFFPKPYGITAKQSKEKDKK
jgi:hypothetical protein